MSEDKSTDDGKLHIDVEQQMDDSREKLDQGVDDIDVEQLEKERQERLDPENRPQNAEVDNTQREFDAEAEEFKIAGEDVENGPIIGADSPEGAPTD